MVPQITIPDEEIETFCRRNHIHKLALFGSVLRNDFRPDSDVDILVEFELDARVNYFTFVGIQDELAKLLNRQVDLHTPQSLSQSFRHKVIQSAKVIYERERHLAPA